MHTLVQEKIKQAVQILNEKNIDLWLTFVRETMVNPDPILPVIYGEASLTRQSAILIHRSAEAIAIVGRIDADTAQDTGAFSKVIKTDGGISAPLLSELQRLNPLKYSHQYQHQQRAGGRVDGWYAPVAHQNVKRDTFSGASCFG